MFYIEDGRKNFYQWDLDRKIICADENITQVHFYYTKDKVLPVKVEDDEQGRYFKVPNILLQKAGQIRLYGYSINHTKIEQQFSILPRPKPEDYIYTEEEYYTIEKIVANKLLEAKESGDFKGEDGLTPFIGENGKWHIGENDTGVEAQGPAGPAGENYILTEQDKIDIAAIVQSGAIGDINAALEAIVARQLNIIGGTD